MNDASGGVAFAIQTIFFEAVQLGVCRLTDPARQAKSKNLTIRALPGFVDEKLRPEILRLVSDAKKTADSARDWRNRKISHSDFDLKAESARPLKPTSRILTTEAIARIHAVLNKIAGWYCDTTLTLTQIGDDDAISFLLHLDAGQRMRMQEAEERERGDYRSLGNRFPGWLQNRNASESRYVLERIMKVPRES